MSGPARVVLLALDGFPPEVVSPDLTPELWRLGTSGGRSAEGGRAPLPSSTYPSFATLLTGSGVRDHGVLTTGRRHGILPPWAGSDTVRIRTLFDACRAADMRSAFVVGDQHLFRVLRPRADVIWPAKGIVPPNTALDAHGYPINDVVLSRILQACLVPQVAFVFGHLNETDTLGHDHGPRDPRTMAAYRATDDAIGVIVRALEPTWDRTVLIIVSDHGMEPQPATPPIEIARGRGVADTLSDGGSALVLATTDPEAVRTGLIEDGLAATAVAVWGRLVLAVAPRGRAYASDRPHAGGFHGGEATVPTVAIVSGGHPSASAIARRIASVRPAQSDWAPTVAALLGLQLPDATGVDLGRQREGVNV